MSCCYTITLYTAAYNNFIAWGAHVTVEQSIIMYKGSIYSSSASVLCIVGSGDVVQSIGMHH